MGSIPAPGIQPKVAAMKKMMLVVLLLAPVYLHAQLEGPAKTAPMSSQNFRLAFCEI